MGTMSEYQVGMLRGVPSTNLNHELLGHPGVSGCSYGFFAPQLGIAAAFMTNGFFSNHQDIDFFRARMVSAIVKDCLES